MRYDVSCEHHHEVVMSTLSRMLTSMILAARPSTIIFIATASTITTRSWTYCHGVMPTAPSWRNWQDLVAGGAACRRS